MRAISRPAHEKPRRAFLSSCLGCAASVFFTAVPGRFFKYWLPVIVWMILIFGASTGLGRPENTSRFVRPILVWLFPLMSDDTINQVHFVVRKTAHFAEYSILGLLLWRLVQLDPAWQTCRSRKYLTALLLAAFYAASDEFHQKFVPGREAAVRDVLLDTCGAGFGLAAVWAARRLRPKKKGP
jgi:VanZ family protein